MTFITNKGLYCHKVMSLGLKNVGRTMKVYADDMLNKSKKAKDHMAHLKDTLMCCLEL